MPIPTVIIPQNISPRPNNQEVEVAWLLARHFQTVVSFISPSKNYRQKSPDISMNGQYWEIKQPVGSSIKYTIESQVRTALRQSSYIIIDTRKTKINDKIITNQLLKRASLQRKIFRILIISKRGCVIDIYKRK